MVKLCDNSYINRFEFLYYFVMVIYMAQMCIDTNRMIAGIGAPWLPFILPIILTVILLWRNNVKLNSRSLSKILIVCIIWEVCVTIHNGLFSTSDQSFQLFLFYSIIVAYIHVQVYQERIVPLYETIIVLFCKISLPLWIFSLLMPSVMSNFASMFPDTNLGHNILYLYNYILPSSEHHLRNSGCAWEPGRFAIMILLGIYCNILRNGIEFRGNKNIFWLLATLLSTMSTTGYLIAILIYILCIFKQSHLKINAFYVIVIIPLVIYLFSLDFMTDKISSQLNFKSSMNKRIELFNYHNQNARQGEYKASLGRFESMFFECKNLIHNPIVGYGRDPKKSYFYNKISSNFYLTGGIVKLLSMYGLILGMYFYFLLYKSSSTLSSIYKNSIKGLLFIIILFSSVSYDIFVVPVFMAFWLYGIFKN